MRIGHALSFLAFAVALFVAAPTWALSNDASPWLSKFHSKTRLVAAKLPNAGGDAKLVVGIHLTLDWGWKTYWRTPGDAGIPPAFDWSGSQNLKRATVLWPAPQRFADPAGSSIGYVGEVVLPVVLEPENAAKPVDIRLRLDYAICKDICAPAQSDMALMVYPAPAEKSSYADLISRYMNRVPKTDGKAEGGPPRVREFTVDIASASPHLSVEADFGPDSSGEDLFVEGPSEVYLPLPKKVETTPDGHIRFRVDLEPGTELKSLKGRNITLTLVSDQGQSETRKRID